MSRFLDELYFLMTEFHNFETEFKTQLSQNYISSNTACLVDAEEVENWKDSVAYDETLEYLENNDKINFDKKQFELRKGTINRNKINFRSYKTLDEVCHSLKHNKRISLVGHQFFCYIDNMTYTPKVFEYYTKNNQLLIYFGEGKCLFIPDFSRYEEKKLSAEEIFIVDLPEDKKIFINCIFTYPNMSDSFQGKRNIALNMTNLLEYIVNKNILNRKFKTYNYYFIDDENNKNIENININKYTINNINNNNNININTTNVNKIITNINEINIDNINNKNLLNSADIYLNNMNNFNNLNNMNNYNNQNMNIYMYGNIQTDKPFIKNDNNNQIIIEKYHYIQNPGNSNDMVIVNGSNNDFESGNNNINEKSNDKDNNKDDFINKNNEYSSEYKNTYKDKEVEYGEILKEKENEKLKNNINTNPNELKIENNNYINGTDKDDNDKNDNNDLNTIKNTIKTEIINIKQTNNNNINYSTPNPDIILKEKNENNIPENNNNNNVEVQNINNINEINEVDETKNLNGQVPNEKEVNNNTNTTTTTKIITHIKIETNTNNPNEETKNININIESNNNNNNQEFTFENYLKHPMVGLDNINGKSSYINSATQCLSHTVPLTNYFLNSKNKERILNNNASLINLSGPQLSPSYLHLLEKLWINTNQVKSVNPSEFVNNLKSLNSSFDKDAESEIGDLIIFILNQLDYELKQTISEEKNIEIKTNDKNLKKSFFYDSVQKNDSIIYDTFFGGICETSKECLKCKEESDLNNNTDENKTYEYTKMNYLMFPINDVYEFVQKNNEKDSINIYDCLNFFQNPIILDNENGKECEKCGKSSSYILVTKINKCQNNLLILLNNDMEKENYIKFNISEILSMSGYVQESFEKKVIYSLYAIICLSKNDKNEIHHIAFCNSFIDKMWYKYDDSKVELINNLNNEVSNYGIPTALFYQKENEEN